jgi:hypothetical protein
MLRLNVPKQVCGVLLLLLVGPMSLAQAQPSRQDLPPLRTRADSVALRVYEAMGGPEVWSAARYLQFQFGRESDGVRQVFRKHAWDRWTGQYRVEWQQGLDSAYVVLFNVNTRQGRAYLNGGAVPTSAEAALLADAYEGFINDTYWLLMPVKLLDPGVYRTYVPDSSNAVQEVIELAFGSVGLTPGDRYWVYVNRATGLVDRWAMVLQGNPTAAPRVNQWTDYQTFETPAGALRLAVRKQGARSALMTDGLVVSVTVPPDLFTDPRPRL